MAQQAMAPRIFSLLCLATIFAELIGLRGAGFLLQNVPH
jgi:hypothetical protein